MRVGEQSASAVKPDRQRASQVQAATQAWTGQLIDLGGRNTLLFYRDLKLGTLDLAAGDEVVLAALFEGRTVALSHLVTDEEAFGQARRRARTIRNKARELVEERGIETCFLAIGMATWDNPTGTATPAAPVLLRQAAISARGAAEDDFSLTLTGEVEVNPTLLHLLAQDFQVDLNGAELVDLLDEQRGFDPVPVYQRLEKETAAVRGFAIRPRLVVGTFSYDKVPMVTDLQANEDVLISHDLIAAMPGTAPPRRRSAGPGVAR